MLWRGPGPLGCRLESCRWMRLLSRHILHYTLTGFVLQLMRVPTDHFRTFVISRLLPLALFFDLKSSLFAVEGSFLNIYLFQILYISLRSHSHLSNIVSLNFIKRQICTFLSAILLLVS